MQIYFRKPKKAFAVSVISQCQDSADSSSHRFLRKTGTSFFRNGYTMAANDLVMQGTRPSADMLLA